VKDSHRQVFPKLWLATSRDIPSVRFGTRSNSSPCAFPLAKTVVEPLAPSAPSSTIAGTKEDDVWLGRGLPTALSTAPIHDVDTRRILKTRIM